MFASGGTETLVESGTIVVGIRDPDKLAATVVGGPGPVDVTDGDGRRGGPIMARMPQLGRSVYAILGLAILVLVVTYGGMAIWPRVEAYRMMRALDRRWHDPGLSAAERSKAAEMLSEYGPEAAPYLLEAARDADARVREQAYAYLAGLEPMTDEAVLDLPGGAEGGPRAPGTGRGGRVAGIDRLHLPGCPGRTSGGSSSNRS